ncbi:MAG TPA: hypothetical protein VFU40_00680 [Gemmatimonadales bacterium]|nr:hypothetical protein [Gemmatimonadales bacterium]
MRYALGRAPLALTLVGCGGGDSSGPSNAPEVTGSWSGQVAASNGQSATLAITVTETGGNVSGSGSLTAGTASLSLGASGTYAPPTLTLTLSAQGFEPMVLTATVEETRLVGVLNGSGFDNRAITMSRQ